MLKCDEAQLFCLLEEIHFSQSNFLGHESENSMQKTCFAYLKCSKVVWTIVPIRLYGISSKFIEKKYWSNLWLLTNSIWKQQFKSISEIWLLLLIDKNYSGQNLCIQIWGRFVQINTHSCLFVCKSGTFVNKKAK